jgi:hypothetical protein
MIDKNLEQRISIKFCVKIGKSTSKMLPLLTSAYGEYAMKKWSVFNDIGGSRKGVKMCKMIKDVGSQKFEGQMQMWKEYEPWCVQIED